MEVFDIYLLEAILNGLLLGGLLALLSLGLNLIFGVIDVVWICYAELIMCGMYAVYYLHVQYHWPLLAAMAAAVVIVAALGRGLHAADGREPGAHLRGSLGARRRARRPRRLPAGAAVRRAPGDRPVLRADHLSHLRDGRPGQHGGWLHRGFRLRAVHLGGRVLLPPRVGLAVTVRFLHWEDVLPAAGNSRPQVRDDRQLPPAPHDPGPAVGLHLYQLVADGPPGPGELRPRRFHGDRRVHRGDAVEPFRLVALGRRACGSGLRGGGRDSDRLSVLPLQDRRPLFRACHARAV